MDETPIKFIEKWPQNAELKLEQCEADEDEEINVTDDTESFNGHVTAAANQPSIMAVPPRKMRNLRESAITTKNSNRKQINQGIRDEILLHKCGHCAARFTTEAFKKQHELSLHTDPSELPVDQQYQCIHCSAKFHSFKLFTAHQNPCGRSRAVQWSSCIYCCATFRMRADYLMHLAKNHAEEETTAHNRTFLARPKNVKSLRSEIVNQGVQRVLDNAMSSSVRMGVGIPSMSAAPIVPKAELEADIKDILANPICSDETPRNQPPPIDQPDQKQSIMKKPKSIYRDEITRHVLEEKSSPVKRLINDNIGIDKSEIDAEGLSEAELELKRSRTISSDCFCGRSCGGVCVAAESLLCLREACVTEGEPVEQSQSPDGETPKTARKRTAAASSTLRSPPRTLKDIPKRLQQKLNKQKKTGTYGNTVSQIQRTQTDTPKQMVDWRQMVRAQALVSGAAHTNLTNQHHARAAAMLSQSIIAQQINKTVGPSKLNYSIRSELGDMPPPQMSRPILDTKPQMRQPVKSPKTITYRRQANNSFECPRCVRVFVDLEHLKLHIRSKHGFLIEEQQMKEVFHNDDNQMSLDLNSESAAGVGDNCSGMQWIDGDRMIRPVAKSSRAQNGTEECMSTVMIVN